MVPYVVGTGSATQQHALMMLTLANYLHIFTVPFFDWLSDRFRWRPVMLGGHCSPWLWTSRCSSSSTPAVSPWSH